MKDVKKKVEDRKKGNGVGMERRRGEKGEKKDEKEEKR